MNALAKAVRQALEANGLWRDGAVLVCALSGGCDSVALLHALCRLRQQKALLVHAVHVQHGLRGADSLEDERFVRQLCRQLDVPLNVENACLTGDMHTPGMETLARERRREIFEHELARLGARALLTAHHQDDQAETVLMHLLRGSGMNGLLGMRASAPFGGALIMRPFLNLSKQQLRSALTAENLSFREDGSNQEAVTPRNALRLEVLPQLETLFPSAGEHMARTAELLAADEAYLLSGAERLYHEAVYRQAPLFMLNVQTLTKAPQALLSRVLRRWFMQGLDAAGLCPKERGLSSGDTLALVRLVSQPAGTRLNLPCGLMAAKESDWLHLVHQSGGTLESLMPFEIPVEDGRALYTLPHLSLEAARPKQLPRDARSVILSPGQLLRRPVMRLPQPEDMIHPFGAPGRKMLRRWFTDHRIDPFLRTVWPVLCVGSNVLWIPGLCASEALRLEHVPKDGIQLTVSGTTPLSPKSPKE